MYDSPLNGKAPQFDLVLIRIARQLSACPATVRLLNPREHKLSVTCVYTNDQSLLAFMTTHIQCSIKIGIAFLN